MSAFKHTPILGYPATASVVAQAQDRLRQDWSRLIGLAAAAVGLTAAAGGGLLTPAAALIAGGADALLAAVLLVHIAGLASARAEATDRLIELDAFAPATPDPRVASTVQRRRRCLMAARNRLSLASAVRRDVRRASGIVPPPPAARLLASCPVLAARIAAELECDQADERVVIEVSRLLAAGAADEARLDRIEALIDAGE